MLSVLQLYVLPTSPLGSALRLQSSLATRECTGELQLPILRILAGGFQCQESEEMEGGIREEAVRIGEHTHSWWL